MSVLKLETWTLRGKWRPEGPATWTAQPLLFPAPAQCRSQPLQQVVGLSARHPGSEGWWGRHVKAGARSVAFSSGATDR